ncbi:MAG: hypothetical protein OXU77_02185 [Gammaproteobacteria bacterium]|nr:hypothetical protein [Gammaproteobacteria bacterium]MDE0441155.1 hypothetical protein [Gammaproteobacteria bacterium]
MAAAAVVGAIGGGAVLGDDHMSGEYVDCSYVSWDCFDECLELTWCVAIPENDGIADCLSERLALAACEADPGGGSGGGTGGGVIIIPGCPGGQHYHAGGGCHADHVCGDDETGGGDEDCKPAPPPEPTPQENADNLAQCILDKLSTEDNGEATPHSVEILKRPRVGGRDVNGYAGCVRGSRYITYVKESVAKRGRGRLHDVMTHEIAHHIATDLKTCGSYDGREHGSAFEGARSRVRSAARGCN